MGSGQGVATAVLLGVLVVGVAVPVLGVDGGSGAGPPAAAPSENGSVGVQMAAFMQSTAADANASVDSGLWQVGVTASAAPDAVRQRARQLDRRLDALQNRSAALAETRANASLPPVVYTARASALRAQVANLRDAVNLTAETARRHGVDEAELERLRSRAATVRGPEVAAIARNITDAGRRGPPADVPGSGSPGEQGAGPGNAAGGGSPDAGPGNEAGVGGSPDAGPGNRPDVPDRPDAANATAANPGQAGVERPARANLTANRSGLVAPRGPDLPTPDANGSDERADPAWTGQAYGPVP
jgi:hypothetical protein